MNKIEKRARDIKENSNKCSISFNNSADSEILRFTGSKYKGIYDFKMLIFQLSCEVCHNTPALFHSGEGLLDSNDLQFIEKRLEKVQSNSQFKETLPYGVSFHHGGLNNVQRSTVEMLFRLGIIKVVCATGTLAVGKNFLI